MTTIADDRNSVTRLFYLGLLISSVWNLEPVICKAFTTTPPASIPWSRITLSNLTSLIHYVSSAYGWIRYRAYDHSRTLLCLVGCSDGPAILGRHLHIKTQHIALRSECQALSFIFHSVPL